MHDVQLPFTPDGNVSSKERENQPGLPGFLESSITYIFFKPIKRKYHKMLKNTLKLPTNCLSMFDHFLVLALKGLRNGKCLMAYSQ